MKSTLTTRDRKKYREQLLSLRSRLSGDVAGLEAEAMQFVGQDNPGFDAPAHQADPAVREAEDDVVRTLLTSEGHILADVRIALARLDAGTFGRCERCGRAMSRARLDALPYARNCLRCARTVDETN